MSYKVSDFHNKDADSLELKREKEAYVEEVKRQKEKEKQQWINERDMYEYTPSSLTQGGKVDGVDKTRRNEKVKGI